MVERITDPHRPVHLPHGTGRLPDGQGVPQPPVTRKQLVYGWIIAAVVVLVALARTAGILR